MADTPRLPSRRRDRRALELSVPAPLLPPPPAPPTQPESEKEFDPLADQTDLLPSEKISRVNPLGDAPGELARFELSFDGPDGEPADLFPFCRRARHRVETVSAGHPSNTSESSEADAG